MIKRILSILAMAFVAALLVSVFPTGNYMRGPMPALAQLQFPLGPYGNFGFFNTAQINTTTIPAFQMVGMVTGTPTAAANYTTDTAVNICSLFPFVGAANLSGASNFAWDWYVKNTSAGAFTITVLGGTGVTVTGTATAAQNNMRHFKMVANACPPAGLTVPTAAITAFSLETAAF